MNDEYDEIYDKEYSCIECGARMEIVDDAVICPQCHHWVEIEYYEDEWIDKREEEQEENYDEDYDELYPPEDEDEDYTGETYDEVCGELDDYTPWLDNYD